MKPKVKAVVEIERFLDGLLPLTGVFNPATFPITVIPPVGIDASKVFPLQPEAAISYVK